MEEVRAQNERDQPMIDATQVKILKREFRKEIEEASKKREKEMLSYQESVLK